MIKNRYQGVDKTTPINVESCFFHIDESVLRTAVAEAESSTFIKMYAEHVEEMTRHKGEQILMSREPVKVEAVERSRGYILGLRQPAIFLQGLKDELARRDDLANASSAASTRR